MNLNIKSGTVGYNNKILASDGTFSLGKSDKVNTSAPSNKAIIIHAPKKSSHRTLSMHSPIPKSVHTSVSMHKEERVALVLALASTFGIWYAFC